MKKSYLKPYIKTYKVSTRHLLAGSENPSATGDDFTWGAKKQSIGFELDNEEDEQ